MSGNPSCPDMKFQPLGSGPSVEAPPPGAKDKVGRRTLRQALSVLLQPGFDPSHRLAGKRQSPGLAALASHSKRCRVQVQLFNAKAAGFADPEPCAVDQLHEDPVSRSDWRAKVGCFQQASDVVKAQGFGQSLLSTRSKSLRQGQVRK